MSFENIQYDYPEVLQEQDVDCGYENSDSTPFEESSRSTDNEEIQEEESVSLSIKQENPSMINSTHIEDMIKQLVNRSLDVDDLPRLEVCLIDN
ncbi:637_t:CDS:2, partial [Dentiscutata erythropus]